MKGVKTGGEIDKKRRLRVELDYPQGTLIVPDLLGSRVSVRKKHVKEN